MLLIKDQVSNHIKQLQRWSLKEKKKKSHNKFPAAKPANCKTQTANIALLHVLPLSPTDACRRYTCGLQVSHTSFNILNGKCTAKAPTKASCRLRN